MSDNEFPKYKKELRGYADMYAVLFRASSKEALIKNNAVLDKTLKGNWLSLHTTAITVYLKRKNGTSLRVLVVTKKGHTNTNCTGLLWLHGGGYAIGLPELSAPYANLFLAEDDCVMVLPDYTRSLDAPYPAALEDAYQTLVWMKENAKALGIREDQLFVGGESAGGGLACALTLYARDHQEVNIAFQMPLYPMLDDRMTETSSHNNSPVWNTTKNLISWKLYRGDAKEVDAYFAPARETDYANLPPAFSIITDNEPFYAETKQYFKNLYAAGTEIMLKEYPGCFHAFDITCPNTENARKARLLERKVFQYAQNHYFAPQLDAEDTAEPSDAEMEAMIQDIETQHAFLDEHKEETVPEVSSISEDTILEEAPDAEVPVEKEELVPEVTDVEEAAVRDEPIEEPVPVTKEAPAEETELADEESAMAEEPEEVPVSIEEPVEETDAASETITEPVEETPVEETEEAVSSAEEALPAVEERPVSESTTVEFPSQIDPSQETITEEEIEAISQQLTAPVEDIPEEFEEAEEAEEIKSEEPEEEVLTETEETKESTKESFTREDVMKLLQKKDEKRQGENIKPYQNEKEDILNNLQKIIEDDTSSSLEAIDDLVNHL